jgi:hypothetical protein
MTIATTQAITAAVVSKLSAILTGWTIYDLSNTPDALDPRSFPCLFPAAAGGFMSDFNLEYQDTGGVEGNRAINLTYRLKYIFCHGQAGEGRGIADSAGMEDEFKSLLVAALQCDALGSTVTGVNQFSVVGAEGGGTVEDYSGNLYYGYIVYFEILELIN